MSISLSAFERETTCICNDEINQWEVYTCQPKIMTKLNKVAEPIWTHVEDGRIVAARYLLDYGQVSFRNKSKPNNRIMSEEHKEKLREHLKSARENKA